MTFNLNVSQGLPFKVIYFFSQALAKFQTTHRVATASGIETEESLLSESAARETSLNSQIIELELEAKQVGGRRCYAT